jgi:hypothetical protein
VSGDSPPFSSKNQQPVGYSIDLCRQVIGHLSRAVGGPEPKVNCPSARRRSEAQMQASGRAVSMREHDRDADADEERRFSGLIFVEVGGPGRCGLGIQGILT